MSEQTKKQIVKVATDIAMEVAVIVAKKVIETVSDIRNSKNTEEPKAIGKEQ